jgi:hypothetical protein
MRGLAREMRSGIDLETAVVTMKHTKSKKLSLNTETIRALREREIARAAGGGDFTGVGCGIENTATRFPICGPSHPCIPTFETKCCW